MAAEYMRAHADHFMPFVIEVGAVWWHAFAYLAQCAGGGCTLGHLRAAAAPLPPPRCLRRAPRRQQATRCSTWLPSARSPSPRQQLPAALPLYLPARLSRRAAGQRQRRRLRRTAAMWSSQLLGAGSRSCRRSRTRSRRTSWCTPRACRCWRWGRSSKVGGGRCGWCRLTGRVPAGRVVAACPG